LASGGHWPWTAPDANRFLDKLEEFLTGAPQAPGRDRVLATVAFTDIVESTAIAASMGDRRWRELLEVHDSVARREVEAARGRMIKSTGDGLLAIFDGPARAIRCVRAIEHGVATLGLHVRAGLHTGEIELLGDDVGGIAVAIAARLTSLASSDEVVVSSTVKDLVVGSGLRFEDRGIHRRPSLVSQRPLGNPQGASPPRLPYWQAPWQSGACHRSAEMPSPFSSCWGAGAPPSGRLWVPLLGGRSQSDARVGCMVWSTTASSSPVRVSRSTWSRSQVLKVAMVWAASWRRPRQGWPTPTPAWPGSVSEALRTAVRERRPIFQGADAVILLVTPPRITGSTDPYQLDDPILPVIPSP
jgi:class 3 adenylate cyclase